MYYISWGDSKMSKHKICGLTLPEDVETFIRKKAEKEHRSISNVVALIVINYVNNEKEN